MGGGREKGQRTVVSVEGSPVSQFHLPGFTEEIGNRKSVAGAQRETEKDI